MLQRSSKIILIALLVSYHMLFASTMSNRLINPSKEGKHIVDIGYKPSNKPIKSKFQKELVKVEAKLKEIEGVFDLQRRKIKTESCYVDDLDIKTCPEEKTVCQTNEEYMPGFIIKHHVSKTKIPLKDIVKKMHCSNPYWCARENNIRRGGIVWPRLSPTRCDPYGDIFIKVYSEDVNFNMVLKNSRGQIFRLTKGGFDSDGGLDYYEFTFHPHKRIGDYDIRTYASGGSPDSPHSIGRSGTNFVFNTPVTVWFTVTDQGSIYDVPIGYELRCKQAKQLNRNVMYGDYKLIPNYGAIDGSHITIHAKYGTLSYSSFISTFNNIKQKIKEGWEYQGKFAMKIFNYGSGWGHFTVYPRPSKIIPIKAESGVSFGDGYGGGGITHSSNGKYGVAILVWNTYPAFMKYSCDDYCLISKPDEDVGFGNPCPKYWHYIGSGKCKVDYTWYEYVCPNQDGYMKFVNAGEIPPFKKEDMINENGMEWLGPLVNSGGDCGGSCNRLGCFCNSPTPPARNCKRYYYTCPYGDDIVCGKVPNGKKAKEDGIYAYGYTYDIGKAEHYERTIKAPFICPGQDGKLKGKPVPVIVESVGDHAYNYGTVPHVSSNRYEWKHHMKMEGISLNRAAFLLNDGTWRVYGNPKHKFGSRASCGWSPHKFAPLPKGMLKVIEWVPASKCNIMSKGVDHECVKKFKLTPVKGKQVVAISDIESVTKSEFGTDACTEDNSFDMEVEVWRADLTKEEAKKQGFYSKVSRKTVKTEPPLAIDIRHVSLMNSGVGGAHYRKDMGVCVAEGQKVCDEGETYVPELDACLVDSKCPGQVLKTGECVVKPEPICPEGYKYDKYMMACVSDKICADGDWYDQSNKRCVSDSIICPQGFIPSKENECVKNGLIYGGKSCVEDFLHGNKCEGVIDFYDWETLYASDDKVGYIYDGSGEVKFIGVSYPMYKVSNAKYDSFEIEGDVEFNNNLVDTYKDDDPNYTGYLFGFLYGAKSDMSNFNFVEFRKGKRYGHTWSESSGFIVTGHTDINDKKDIYRKKRRFWWFFSSWKQKFYYNDKSKFHLKIRQSKGQLKVWVDNVLYISKSVKNSSGRIGVYAANTNNVKFSNMKINFSSNGCKDGWIKASQNNGEDKMCIKYIEGAHIDEVNNRYTTTPLCPMDGYYNHIRQRCEYVPNGNK